MKTFKDYKKQQMQDTELGREYEAIQPEMDVIRAIGIFLVLFIKPSVNIVFLS